VLAPVVPLQEPAFDEVPQPPITGTRAMSTTNRSCRGRASASRLYARPDPEKDDQNQQADDTIMPSTPSPRTDLPDIMAAPPATPNTIASDDDHRYSPAKLGAFARLENRTTDSSCNRPPQDRRTVVRRVPSCPVAYSVSMTLQALPVGNRNCSNDVSARAGRGLLLPAVLGVVLWSMGRRAGRVIERPTTGPAQAATADRPAGGHLHDGWACSGMSVGHHAQRPAGRRRR